jgi:pimeloyl-ACP methyl ester carboxylesterase
MGAMFNDTSWQSAEPVKIPVLAVFAANSQLGDSPAMKTVFPTAEVHQVPGTGHFLMLEKPTEFNKLLSDFLAKLH